MSIPMKDTVSHTSEVTLIEATADSIDGLVTIVNPDPRIGQLQITAEQLRSLRRKYEQSTDGAKSLEEFLTRVTSRGVGTDSYLFLPWCGMWLGIETDGYTHS